MVNEENILDAEDITLVLERLASEIIERHHGLPDLLVGIERRGVDLARRLVTLLEEKGGGKLPLGTLDINLYRDDWTTLKDHPIIGTSYIPHDITNQDVLLVDDVLFSGRTVRAALDALLDYGRPKRVELLVLIDRGHRELPIQADYVGKYVQTEHNEQVMVLLNERDGEECVKKQVLQ